MRAYITTAAMTGIAIVLATAGAQSQSKPAAAAQKPAAQSAPAKPAATETPSEEPIPAPAPDALFPAVVARVNGRPILGRDLETKVREQLAPMGNPAWKNLREDYRLELTAESLGALLAAELLYQKAVASGILVSETEVKTEFERVQKGFRSDAEMNLLLAERGMDRTALRRSLEKGLVVAKFIQENIAKKVTVTPAEVQSYYSGHSEEFKHPDVVRTSHILILVPQDATPEQDKAARLRAEGLLARVKKGEDFARLARENSMDDSASQGGDLGYVPKGQMAPEYETVAFNLPVGSVSDVVRTKFGYHVVKVTDRRKEGVSTIEEIRADLQEFLKRQKVDAETDKLVRQLRDQAKIELYVALGDRAPSQNQVLTPRP